jgi:hypothetical protein
MGTLGTVFSGVSMGADIAGAIGTFRLEGTMNAVESNTRYCKGILQTLADLANLHLPKLESIWGYLWDIQAPAWHELLDKVGSGGSGDSRTINVYLDGKLIWKGLESQAKLAGA